MAELLPLHPSPVIASASSTTNLCNENVNTNNCHIKTGFEHFLHKNCFNKYIENNSNCPQCGVALTSPPIKNNPINQPHMITSQQTRNQNANLGTAALQPEPIINAGVTDDKESRINRLVSAAASAQQTQLFSELKQQMTTLIQSSLEKTFRDFGAPDPSLSMPSFETRPNIPQLPPVRRNEETRPLIHPSKAVEKILSLPSEGTTPQSPGKNVLQILFMWLPRYHILPLALSEEQYKCSAMEPLQL
uniref:RING-type domain-containing protein n=1 Tax=Glossina palpalis gambiensis TaxID=67801 RepID=A0A1B0BTN1_9MUSC